MKEAKARDEITANESPTQDIAMDCEDAVSDEMETGEENDDVEDELEEPKQASNSREERLLKGKGKLRALVLCPTRELAMQVCNTDFFFKVNQYLLGII